LGVRDLMQIYPIVQECRKLSKRQFWDYNFKWDQGCFETLIAINEEKKTVRKPDTDETWESITYPEQPFCPDILEWNFKIAIEFEETEGKPRTGAKLAKKGHNADGLDKRTSRRDEYYKLAGFNVLKIFDYESEQEWKPRLRQFLLELYLAVIKTA